LRTVVGIRRRPRAQNRPGAVPVGAPRKAILHTLRPAPSYTDGTDRRPIMLRRPGEAMPSKDERPDRDGYREPRTNVRTRRNRARRNLALAGAKVKSNQSLNRAWSSRPVGLVQVGASRLSSSVSLLQARQFSHGVAASWIRAPRRRAAFRESCRPRVWLFQPWQNPLYRSIQRARENSSLSNITSDALRSNPCGLLKTGLILQNGSELNFSRLQSSRHGLSAAGES